MTHEQLDYAALKAVAEAATEGPWHIGSGGGWKGVYVWIPSKPRDEQIFLHIQEQPEDIPEQDVNDFVYVATFNPSLVLSLLDELERLRAECDAYDSTLGGMSKDLEKAHRQIETLKVRR